MRMLGLTGLLALVVAGAGAQDVKRPAITGVAFARFYVSDAAAADAFYGKTLGLEKEAGSDGRTVYPVNGSQWIETVAAEPPSPTARLAAMGFTTRDAKGLERYLTAHGVKTEIPMHEGEFGVRDPEGHLVMFVQAGSNKTVAHAQASPTAAGRRMIHVGFLVADQAAEDKFWQQTLGFHTYWHGGRTPDRTDYYSVQVPEGSDWVEYMLNVGPNPKVSTAGVMNHISLGVVKMDDAIATLGRNGCTDDKCKASKTGVDGKVQLNLYDPDLTRVEMMEFLPVKEPCCSPFMGKQPGPVEEK